MKTCLEGKMRKNNEQILKVIRKGINSKPQAGQSLTEYSLLLALVAVVVIGILGYLGMQLGTAFNSVAAAIGTPTVADPSAVTTVATNGGNSGGGSGGSGGTGGSSGGDAGSGGSGGTGSGTGGSGGTGTGGSGGSGGTGGTGTGGGTAATPAVTTPAATTPAATTAVPTTTAPATTTAPTTATTTGTPKPTTAVPTTAAPTTAAPTTAPPTTAVPTTVTSQNFGVNYTISASWYNGYNISVDIINKTNAPVTAWTISWKMVNGENFQNYWNANCSLSGGTVTCTNMSYNNTIAANGGTVNFGAQLNSPTGAITQPITFTVNGQTVSR